MKNIGIRINSTDKNFLLAIIDICGNYCNTKNWKLLFLEGTYFDKMTFEMENKISSSKKGIDVTLIEVRHILSKINDLWNILLIGYSDIECDIQYKDNDTEIFNSSDIVIEYFDSSYWTIACRDTSFIERLKKEFENIYKVTYPIIF